MNNLIALFWLADVMNLPFMEMFDTTYPLNGWFWFIFYAFLYAPTYVKLIAKRK